MQKPNRTTAWTISQWKMISFLTNGGHSLTKGTFVTLLSGPFVVYYIAIPKETISNCLQCEVRNVTPLIEELNLHPSVGTGSKPPDHSLVTLSFLPGFNISFADAKQTESNKYDHIYEPCKRYYFNEIPQSFMNSQRWAEVLDLLLERISLFETSVFNCDRLYSDLYEAIFPKMNEHLSYKIAGHRSKKKFKYHKPFWNNHSTISWKEMSKAEKLFMKCESNNPERRTLRGNFV